MNSPFATASTVAPITDAQRRYLRDLMLRKAALLGKDADEDQLDTWLDGLSKTYASQQIDSTNAILTALKADNARKGAVIRDHRQADAESMEGFWELPDGRVVKVQRAVVQGSGNPYGKVLDPDTGRFSYSPGILANVRAHGSRLPLERAKELGKLYGICICCGRTLTDEYSIANGIGPICAQRL